MKKLLITFVSAMLGGSFAIAADSVVPKDYPLKTCPVSGEELGSDDMAPVKVTHEGTDVWLCCKMCKSKFDKDPAKYTKVVNDAAAKK